MPNMCYRILGFDVAVSETAARMAISELYIVHLEIKCNLCSTSSIDLTFAVRCIKENRTNDRASRKRETWLYEVGI